MEAVTRWLAGQARRERRVRFLDDALLGGRFGSYAAYRLRYFLARYAAASAVHAVKFLLLLGIFSLGAFVDILRFHAAAGLVAAFWWGALEVMRGRVRELHRGGRPHLVPREVGRWIALAGWLATAVVGSAVAWTTWRLAAGRGFGPADLYVVAIFLRLAAGLVARCYHSGIYALRRVYRPLPAMLGIDLGAFVGVLVLWPWLAAWSLPVAALVSTAAVTATTLHFTRRSYRFMGFSLRGRLSPGSARAALRGGLAELVLAGLSHALIRLDAVLVLVLFRPEGRAGTPVADLFVLFFVLGPTIRAAAEWAHLLYFDLKRMEVALFANLRRGFDRAARRLAVLLGLVFWAAAGVIATVVSSGRLGSLLWLLLPFFLSRSLLALEQVRAFAERRYLALVGTGGILVAALGAIGTATAGERSRLMLVTAVLAGGGATLAWVRRARAAAGSIREPLWPSTWIARLRETPGEVRVRAVAFTPPAGLRGPANVRRWGREERWRRRRVAERLASALEGSGQVTELLSGRVLWFERRDREVAAGRVLTEGGGQVRWLRETDWHEDGEAALTAAISLGLLDGLPAAAVAGDPADLSALIAEFSERFPDGIVCAPGRVPIRELAAISGADRRSILHDATVFARDLRPHRRRSTIEVTSVADRGSLLAVFISDRRTREAGRRRWRGLVARFNVQLALDGARGNGGGAGAPARGGGRWMTTETDGRRPAPAGRGTLASASR